MSDSLYQKVTDRLVFDPYSEQVYRDEVVHELKRESCQLLKTGIDVFLGAGHTLDRAVWSIKHNGWRFLASCAEDGTVTFRTRNGNTYNFPVIASSLKVLAGRVREQLGLQGEVVFDGELTSSDDNPDTLKSLIEGGTDGGDLMFRIFDIVDEEKPLQERLDMLYRAWVWCDEATGLCVVPHHYFLEDETRAGVEHVKALALAAGHEGIVIKNLDAPYVFRRTADWVREVAVFTEDLRVLRVKPGRAGRVTLICDRGGREVGMSAGISRELGKEFLKTPPAMVEVSHRGETGSGSLKSAAFKRVRVDK